MQFSVARRVAVGCLATASLAALPAVAGAKTTKISGTFKLPAGETFSLTDSSLNGCDPLAYGYDIGSKPKVTIASTDGSACVSDPEPDTVVGPFAKTVTFRVFLEDSIDTPPFVFWSTNHKHTAITDNGDGSYSIQTGDADFGSAPPKVVYHGGNLTTTLTISAPAG